MSGLILDLDDGAGDGLVKVNRTGSREELRAITDVDPDHCETMWPTDELSNCERTSKRSTRTGETLDGRICDGPDE
jgi:hypothetical protein